MLRGRFVRTLRMPWCPLFPLTPEEVSAFVEERMPAMRGEPYTVAF